MAENFPFPIPASWYALTYSDELKTGEVLPVRLLNQQLVVFRDESGRAAVLDAFCPHLGAHFGHGGSVAGSRIRCPFHAWEFDGRRAPARTCPTRSASPPA